MPELRYRPVLIAAYDRVAGSRVTGRASLTGV